VLEQEHIRCDAASLQLLAHSAQGSMRDALSILDQAIAFGEGKIEEAGVRDMLGAVDQGYLYDLLGALAIKDGARMLAIADAMETRSLSFDSALQDLATLLHRLALAQIVPAAIDEDTPERGRIFELARTFAPEDIQLFYQIAIHGRDDLSRAPDEYAGFTMTLMRMLAFVPEEIIAAEGKGAAKPAEKTAAIVRSSSCKEPGVDKEPVVDTEVEYSPLPVPEPPPAAQPDFDINSFSSGWVVMVNHLRLSGMTKMLAQHCEVKNVSSNEIEFCVPEMHKHLLDKAYQGRMQTALREHLGKPVRLKFSVGVVTGITAAELVNREKQEKQSQAIAAIESDPFVRDMVEHFDAKLIVSSIKPIQ
jgi:DNA polymerase-3 subunit gamma/tau